MKNNARVLYVMEGDFSEFKTLKQILLLAEEYQLELTLFDITQAIAPPRQTNDHLHANKRAKEPYLAE